MLPPPDAALAHYSDRQSLVTAGAEVAAQMWSDVDPARIVESWTTQVPELAAVLSGAQLGAARQADPYVDEVAVWQDADPATESPVDPKAFAGAASDGRGLMSLLMSPAFSVLQVIASGLGSREALSLGGQHLDTIARTQVADAGRLADGVSLAAHKGLDGYVRVVVGKTCSRCIVLAGKHYRWNAGFQRHPHCDCIHLPCRIADAGKLLQDPHKLYQSMTDKQRSAAGWSKADQQALADGADIFQVTNAHKGVYTAGGRKFTTEGTTKRGFAGSRLGKRKARLTPEQIYLEAGEDRDAALRLLYDQGYLIQEPAVVKRADLVLAAAKPSPTALAGPATAARSVIRPELAAAKGTAQLADAFKAEAKRVSGRDVGAAFEGSLQTAKEHAEGLLRGLERFPGAKLRYVGVRSMADNAYAVASSTGEIRFDFAYTEAKARRDYLSSTARDAREVTEFGEQLPGWHPRGTGNPMGIAVHEFGHIVDLATLAERVGPDVEALIVRRAAVIPTDVPTWVRAKWGPDTLVRREISGYATTNTHELIAEAFADVMVNGEAASALSREIFDLLESEYRKGGFVVGAGKIGMSEAAPALSKLTVAKLRELAKTRGIRVPSRALKADIVALLEPPKVLTGAAKRAAARVRQAEIDRRGQVADLLAEMDELIAKKAEAAVFAQRLDHAVATGMDAATVATLRRAVGDTTKLRAAMTRVGTKNGIKAVGRAGQKVEFDEALHEPVGGAPKAGAQVVVVRRGTTLEFNGEQIRLSKARISTVAPAKRAPRAAPVKKTPALRNRTEPSLKDLMRGPGSAPPTLERQQQISEAFARAVDGVYPGGLRVVATGGSQVGERCVTFGGEVRDARGNVVGYFNRNVGYDPFENAWYAYHESLYLNAEVQGSGFARAFNDNLIDWYRRSGIEEVRISAADIGSYAWATQGFDFTADQIAYMLKNGDIRPAGQNGVGALGAALDRFASGEYVSAYELSQAGRLPGQTGRDAMWPGKRFMLDLGGWSGRMPL